MTKEQLICLQNITTTTSNLRFLKALVNNEVEQSGFIGRAEPIRDFIDVMDKTIYSKYSSEYSMEIKPMDKKEHKDFREALMTHAELPVPAHILEEWVTGPYKANTSDLLYLPIIRWMKLSTDYFMENVKEAIALGLDQKALNYRTIIFQLMLNKYISDSNACTETKIDYLSTELECLLYPMINSSIRMNSTALTSILSEYKGRVQAEGLANAGTCFRLQDLSVFCPISTRIKDEDLNIKDLRRCIGINYSSESIDPWKFLHATYWEADIWNNFTNSEAHYIATYNNMIGINPYLLDEYHLYKRAEGLEDKIYEILDINANLSNTQCDMILDKLETGDYINPRMYEKYLSSRSDILKYMHEEVAELYGDGPVQPF